MSMEILQSIKNTEKEAEHIIRQSVSNSRQMIAEAQSQSYKFIQQAEEVAAQEAKKIISDGEKIVESKIHMVKETIIRECHEMQQQAEKKLDDAVDLIIGRIVRAHVNS